MHAGMVPKRGKNGRLFRLTRSWLSFQTQEHAQSGSGAETWGSGQVAPLNPKSAIIPNPGIMADLTLMLAAYPTATPLYSS